VTEARPALRVRSARLHQGRPGDAARLAGLLAQATPAATGVPDQALLLVRRLAVPAPIHRAEHFGRALVDGLRAARAGARRPGQPGEGDLYFPDAATLEIALVHAALAGGPPDPLLIAHVPDAAQPLRRWRRLWLQQPLALAPLLVRMDAAGLAAPWLARLAPEELAVAACRVAAAHGMAPAALASMRAALAAPLVRAPSAKRLAALPLPVAAALRRALTESASTASQAASGSSAARLLAIASIASQAASGSSAAWLLAIASIADTRPDMLASPALTRTLPRAAPGTPAARSQAAAVAPRLPDAAPATEAAPASARHRSAPRQRTGPPAARPAPRANTGHRAKALLAALPPSLLQAAPLKTGFAGLFFLLNALAAMGVVASIAAPRPRWPGLSAFALLWLLGRHWGGAAFLADPLAPLLRQCAGLAPNETVAAQFDPPRWRVPADWLAPWSRQRRRLIRRGRRWHAAGFPLDDPARAGTQAGRRRRWLADLARYVAARLGVAMALPADAAVALLLHRPASIRIDDDRLIIAMALDTHPLALRLAGLDRDPGRLAGTRLAVGFEFA
jgi:hypothetical protein